MNKDRKLLTDFIADFFGSSASALTMFSFPGIEGVFVGSTYGALVSNTLKAAVNEINGYHLSQREKIRVHGAFAFAIKKIFFLQEQGKTIREDSFFETKLNNRSDGEEILEGVIIAAQKSHEEKKIKHLGYLFANIAYDESIDKEWANYYIKIAQSLSFRQLCLISIYTQANKYPLLNPEYHSQASIIIRMDTMSELYDLRDKALVKIHASVMSDQSKRRQWPPNHIQIEYMGEQLFNLMSLIEIDESELKIVGRHIGLFRNEEINK